MEYYTWAVELSDHKLLYEETTSFKEVISLSKAGRILYFMLQPKKDFLKPILIKLGGKRKLIFFRRRMNYVGPEGKLEWTIHILGWEENVKGISIKAKMFIFPTGEIEMNNDESQQQVGYHQKLVEQFKSEYNQRSKLN